MGFAREQVVFYFIFCLLVKNCQIITIGAIIRVDRTGHWSLAAGV